MSSRRRLNRLGGGTIPERSVVGRRMCGIAMEVRFDGEPLDPSFVRNATRAMRGRGPDGQGLFLRDSLALGHRRLRVIDLSEHAAQPMIDPTLSLAIVFNGCIYNYRELRQELEGLGYRFFSEGDTEVLLKAYHRFGESFVERLQGMFAFAIVDLDDRSVFLGRDRLGIKPLYYSTDGGTLRVASNVQALLAGGNVDTSIDPVALHHYMTFHAVVPPPRTILKGVRKLPPATTARIEPDGSQSQKTYWTLPFGAEALAPERSEEEWREAIDAALRTAVERRLVADVPVGVLLSGGLDSSLIVALLAQNGAQGLETFSIGFESVGGRAGDEFQYSQQVADRYATNHHVLRISSDRTLDALTGAIQAMSEPMVSHDAVAFYLLSQEVSRHVKVVQSGQGADEVFGGYHWYPPMMEKGVDPVARYASVFFDRTHEELTEIVGERYRLSEDVSRAFVASHFQRPGATLPIDRAMRIDQEIMLVDDPVKRVDNMTMAFGLEARVPFLDHELVELAAACPPELKLAQGGKGILKDVARPHLPASVIDREKGYFPVPALTHLEGSYLDLVREALTDRSFRELGLFEPRCVDQLLARPNEELTPLGGNKLWQIGLLALWLDLHGIT